MTDPMNGAVAIVTGGGTGIGAATVALLARRGVRSVVNYAHSRDSAEAAAAKYDGIAIRADVADDAQCRALAAAALQEFGRLDFLVNNAGRTKHVAHEDLDGLEAEDFLDIYRLNLVAPFQMIRACREALAASPMASVVNIASVAGVHGIGSSVAYAASKGALITMTQSLARVLAPQIRLNAIAPGYVGTEWFEKQFGVEGLAKVDASIAARVPLSLAAKAPDIAGPIVNLLDPASRAITGQTLVVDAGASLDTGLSRRPGRENA